MLDAEIPKYLDFIQDEFELEEIIGEGSFSTVYKARCKRTNIRVAIKAITKTSAPNRVVDELEIIKKLEGKNNCIRLLRVMRERDQILAIFPLVSGTDFKDFLVRAGPRDCKNYMRSLLTALQWVHSLQIIHRDLKPSNFMYDMQTGEGWLIDFGLAQYDKKINNPTSTANKQPPALFFNSIVIPSKPPGYYERDSRPNMRAPRAGTRGFRAPEVLFRYDGQSSAIDIWSVGVIFLCILTCQYPFFLSVEDIDNLTEIFLIFGNIEMRKAARLYGRVWKSNLPSIKEGRIPFNVLISNLNPSLNLDQNALDLLEKMLDLNCNTRITAEQALEHPYFK